jgi:SAM-dependent methyltransferase
VKPLLVQGGARPGITVEKVGSIAAPRATAESRWSTRVGLSYNKLCDVEDFGDPELRGVIRDVCAYDVERFGPTFPRGREYRKYWEIAMAVRALRDYGALGSTAEVLGIGAGIEPTIFWLTRHARRVFATDLYLEPGDWAYTAQTPMLVDPGEFAPYSWNPRRLVVQHMNALELRYEDGSFDGIFSSSSIEHFGTLEDVRRSAEEMFRVLKPGGVAAISTEFRLAGPAPGLPGILMFDELQLHASVVGDLRWTLVSPLDLSLSSETYESGVPFEEAAADVRAGRDWSRYPHIVLTQDDLVWTSVHLTLQKSI